MYISGTDISCGIRQLAEVGWNATKYTLNETISYDGKYILIASLTSQQTKAIKLLLKNGFKKVGKWCKNPNSGNKIALFVRMPGVKRKRRSK